MTKEEMQSANHGGVREDGMQSTIEATKEQLAKLEMEADAEVGGKSGDDSVILARLCGIIPVLGREEDLEEEDVSEDEENGLFSVSYREYRAARQGLEPNKADY